MRLQKASWPTQGSSCTPNTYHLLSSLIEISNLSLNLPSVPALTTCLLSLFHSSTTLLVNTLYCLLPYLFPILKEDEGRHAGHLVGHCNVLTLIHIHLQEHHVIHLLTHLLKLKIHSLHITGCYKPSFISLTGMLEFNDNNTITNLQNLVGKYYHWSILLLIFIRFLRPL